MLDICTEMDWIICLEWKDATSIDGNDNYQPSKIITSVGSDNGFSGGQGAVA